MHDLSAASSTQQRPEKPSTRAPSNSSFPNRHDGDFRYVKLCTSYKKTRHKLPEPSEVKLNLLLNVAVKKLMLIFLLGSDLMLA